jgi:hypothetical protein
MGAGDSLGEQFDWRMNHRPGGPGDAEEVTSAPAHDLTQIYPSDFWRKPQNYWYNDPDSGVDQETTELLRQVRGNPDAEVEIHRSLPPEHADKGILPGDWVTLSRKYAEQHGMHNDDPSQDWPVVSRTVRAGDIYTSGDSLAEWGWHPRD